MSEIKKCIICKKELESIYSNWDTMQPYGGGEVYFIFSYGSRKLDLYMGTTEYRGVICDDCAIKLIDEMEEVENGQNNSWRERSRL